MSREDNCIETEEVKETKEETKEEKTTLLMTNYEAMELLCAKLASFIESENIELS